MQRTHAEQRPSKHPDLLRTFDAGGSRAGRGATSEPRADRERADHELELEIRQFRVDAARDWHHHDLAVERRRALQAAIRGWILIAALMVALAAAVGALVTGEPVDLSLFRLP